MSDMKDNRHFTTCGDSSEVEVCSDAFLSPAITGVIHLNKITKLGIVLSIIIVLSTTGCAAADKNSALQQGNNLKTEKIKEESKQDKRPDNDLYNYVSFKFDCTENESEVEAIIERIKAELAIVKDIIESDTDQNLKQHKEYKDVFLVIEMFVDNADNYKKLTNSYTKDDYIFRSYKCAVQVLKNYRKLFIEQKSLTKEQIRNARADIESYDYWLRNQLNDLENKYDTTTECSTQQQSTTEQTTQQQLTTEPTTEQTTQQSNNITKTVTKTTNQGIGLRLKSIRNRQTR